MLHFRSAYTVGKCSECAVGGGVAVTTHNSHAWQRKALFRADNVDNSLTLVVFGVILNAEISGVFGKRLDLNPAFLVFNTFHAIGRSRNIVIHNRQGFLWLTDLATGHAQTFECLRACHFVNEVPVDIKE